jgi:HAD superfamily hydrolase (TIGR01484 family)
MPPHSLWAGLRFNLVILKRSRFTMILLPKKTPPAFLLSFDFDGTLCHHGASPSVNPRFFQLLTSLRENHGISWGINTGRSLEHLIFGMKDCSFPLLPDWVIAREREIYIANHTNEFDAHQDWNLQCQIDLDQVIIKSAELLKAIRSFVENETTAEWYADPDEPAGIIAKTEQEMDSIVAKICSLADKNSELGWHRSTVYLRFGQRNYDKGSSLKEVARIHQLSHEKIFAIGDNHNDREQLIPTVAKMIACPSNAVIEVKTQVLQHNGYVSEKSHSCGVIEALENFF